MADMERIRAECAKASEENSETLGRLQKGFMEAGNNAGELIFEAVGPIRAISYYATRQAFERTASRLGAVLGDAEEGTLASRTLHFAEGAVTAMDALPALRDQAEAKLKEALDAVSAFQAGVSAVQYQGGKLALHLYDIQSEL